MIHTSWTISSSLREYSILSTRYTSMQAAWATQIQTSPDTHHCWVGRDTMEWEVYPTLLRMTSTGNRTVDLWSVPLGHMLPCHSYGVNFERFHCICAHILCIVALWITRPLNFFLWINSYSASHNNWCTAILLNRIITAQCEGMGEVGSARYEPALLSHARA